MKHKKRKQTKLYLLRSDIKELNKEYSLLYRDVKNDQNLSVEQIARECEILLEKYNFEIEELSDFREAEYWEHKAEIEAKYAEETPFRRCWLWKLIFQPTTNRAQDIIEEKAALDAEEKFAPMEKELDSRAEKLYAGTGKILSRRKRQRIMKKYLKLRDKLIGDSDVKDDAGRDAGEQSLKAEAPTAPAAVVDVQSGAEKQQLDVDVTEPPEPPARIPRKAKQPRV